MITERDRRKAEYDAAEYELIEAKAAFLKFVTLLLIGADVDLLAEAAHRRVKECQGKAAEAHLRCEELGIPVVSHAALIHL